MGRVVLAAVMLAAGCGGGGDGSVSRTARPAADPVGGGAPVPASTPAPIPVVPPPTAVGPVTPDLQVIVDAALADASRRTGIARSALQVVSAEAVTWADGSIGCAEPGVAYTMALVPGFRVRIRAGGELLDYHASRRGGLILCPPGRAVDPVPLDAK